MDTMFCYPSAARLKLRRRELNEVFARTTHTRIVVPRVFWGSKSGILPMNGIPHIF